MKKIHILLLRNFAGPLIITFFISLFILVMQFLWKYVDELVGKGLEWYLILQLLFYASATFVPLAIPLSILLSSLMTFGNLGERNELVAMKSAGISLREIMLPLIVLSFIISIFAFFFANNIQPVANLKMGSLLYDIREQKPALSIKEDVFYGGIEGYIIKVGKKSADNKTVYNVMIFDHTERFGNNNFTLAESGIMEMTPDKRYLIFKLFNGYNYYEDMKKEKSRARRPMTRTKFQEETRSFDLSGFSLQRTNEEYFKTNFQMLNLKQLGSYIDSAGHIIDKIKQESALNFRNSYANLKELSATNAVDNSLNTIEKDIPSLPEDIRYRVFENALNNARNNRNNIEYYINNIDSQKKLLIRHKIEWHRKFSLSLACFLLFFIGAPLGAIIRKGGFGLPVVVSTLFFLLYHVISFTGEKFVRSGVIEAGVGMWISSALILPLGIFLTYKASMDSPLFDVYSWVLFFRKIFRRKGVQL